MSRSDQLARVAYRIAARTLHGVFFVVRPHLHGVAVLVRHEGELLLIRNSYRRSHGVPGGLRRRREPAAEAAARELREETGIAARPSALRFLERVDHFHGFVHDHVSFFELAVDERPDVAVDRREVVWAGWHREDQARALRLWPPLAVYLERERARAGS